MGVAMERPFTKVRKPTTYSRSEIALMIWGNCRYSKVKNPSVISVHLWCLGYTQTPPADLVSAVSDLVHSKEIFSWEEFAVALDSYLTSYDRALRSAHDEWFQTHQLPLFKTVTL